MVFTSDFMDRATRPGPRSLWEAVGLLVYLREQETIALRDETIALRDQTIALRPPDVGKAAQMGDLRRQQAVAWAYIRTFAEELIRRGEPPPTWSHVCATPCTFGTKARSASPPATGSLTVWLLNSRAA